MIAHVLHGAVIHVLAALGGFFLPVQGDHHRMRRRAGLGDDVDRFAYRRARRHHVIDDQHTALQRRADQRSALAMVLGFLAVVGPGQVAPQARQLDGQCRGQRDAFVGRAEDHVELRAALDQALRIELRQAR